MGLRSLLEHLAILTRKFCADRRGQFALVLGLLSPIMLGLVGGAVDFIVFNNHRAELQATADAAVLAVAKEASLKGWNAETAQQIADAVVRSTLSHKFGVEYSSALSIAPDARRIDITLNQDHYSYFVVGYFVGSPQIVVRSAAIASGVSTLCIIVQSPSQKDSLVVNGSSKVRASGCGAYSNSTSTKSVNVKDSSQLRVQTACTAGGYAGRVANFDPIPTTDCPPIPDPLAARAKIIDGSLKTQCDVKKLVLKDGTHKVSPGTYCDDLKITDGARVEFEPGIYVFLNKKLKVDKAAGITGSGVGLVFVGDGAVLELANESSVSLSAPETGIMAGILIYGQRTKSQRKFSIVSKDAQQLTGTVYLPGDTLTVGGDEDLDGGCDPVPQEDGTYLPADPACLSDVGKTSDWTAIIVKQLKVTAGSTLVMNSNYDASTVPVPEGVRASNRRVLLAR